MKRRTTLEIIRVEDVEEDVEAVVVEEEDGVKTRPQQEVIQAKVNGVVEKVPKEEVHVQITQMLSVISVTNLGIMREIVTHLNVTIVGSMVILQRIVMEKGKKRQTL